MVLFLAFYFLILFLLLWRMSVKGHASFAKANTVGKETIVYLQRFIPVMCRIYLKFRTILQIHIEEL